MAYPYQFQGGMFGAPQGGYNMRQQMMQRGGYGMRQPMNFGVGLDRMGGSWGNMARQGGAGRWDTMNSSMDGPVGDPSGAFRPPSFSSGPMSQVRNAYQGALGGGMFGPVTGGQNIETAPATGPQVGSTGFTGIPPWNGNTPPPALPPDGFGGPSQPGRPVTPVTGGPPGSVGPNGQPLTQIDYTNRAQLGTPQGDQQASTNALLGFINQYGREQGLAMYRQMLDNQPMRADALGGGGEYAPINLNRGIAYR